MYLKHITQALFDIFNLDLAIVKNNYQQVQTTIREGRLPSKDTCTLLSAHPNTNMRILILAARNSHMELCKNVVILLNFFVSKNTNAENTPMAILPYEMLEKIIMHTAELSEYDEQGTHQIIMLYKSKYSMFCEKAQSKHNKPLSAGIPDSILSHKACIPSA